MLSKIKEINIFYENNGCTLVKVFFRYINWAIKKVNPKITYKIYGQKVLIPYAHDLPNILSKYPMYGYNLKRIATYCKKLIPDFSVIDVGANIGDTSILLNNASYPILCIEGDSDFFDLLIKNTKKLNTTCINYLVSDNVDQKLSILSKHGSGRVESGIFNNVRTSSLDDILSDLNKNFRKSMLLKIDTDGFDLAILRSAHKYIKSARPIIFLEFDPYLLKIQGESSLDIFTFLKDLDYTNAIIYDNFGYLIMSLDLSNVNAIRDLNLYFSSRGNEFYADICFFNKKNQREFEFIFNKESKYYESQGEGV